SGTPRRCLGPIERGGFSFLGIRKKAKTLLMVARQHRLSSLVDVLSAPDCRARGEQNTQREPCHKIYHLHSYLLFRVLFHAARLKTDVGLPITFFLCAYSSTK